MTKPLRGAALHGPTGPQRQWLPFARDLIRRGYTDCPGEFGDRTDALVTLSGLRPNTVRAIFRHLDANPNA